MTSWTPKSRQPRGSTLRPRATTRSMAVNPTGAGGADSAASAADVGHLDLRRRRGLGRPELGVAVRAAPPDRAEALGELLVGGAETQRRAQIVAASREEARVQPSLGRQAGAGATAAERLCDGRDDADLSRAVEVAPAARSRVRPLGRHRLERPPFRDAADDLVGADDVL